MICGICHRALHREYRRPWLRRNRAGLGTLVGLRAAFRKVPVFDGDRLLAITPHDIFHIDKQQARFLRCVFNGTAGANYPGGLFLTSGVRALAGFRSLRVDRDGFHAAQLVLIDWTRSNAEGGASAKS